MAHKPRTQTVGGFEAMIEATRKQQIADLKSHGTLKVIEIDLEADKEQEVRLYTIPAAAEAAGVEERTLRRAVANGKVRAMKIEGSPIRVVTLEDVLDWKNNRKSKSGRPKSVK